MKLNTNLDDFCLIHTHMRKHLDSPLSTVLYKVFNLCPEDVIMRVYSHAVKYLEKEELFDPISLRESILSFEDTISAQCGWGHEKSEWARTLLLCFDRLMNIEDWDALAQTMMYYRDNSAVADWYVSRFTVSLPRLYLSDNIVLAVDFVTSDCVRVAGEVMTVGKFGHERRVGGRACASLKDRSLIYDRQKTYAAVHRADGSVVRREDRK